MNSNAQCSQQDMFATVKGGFTPVEIEIRGLEVTYKKEGKEHTLRGIPSFKTGKMAIGWLDKATGKIQARPLTLPEHRKWMDRATLLIESRLRSIFQITDAKIRTVASPHSWIATLMPLDDSWTWCRETEIKSRKCEPGQEGAVIRILRLT